MFLHALVIRPFTWRGNKLVSVHMCEKERLALSVARFRWIMLSLIHQRVV